jgi:hypothetical protein
LDEIRQLDENREQKLRAKQEQQIAKLNNKPAMCEVPGAAGLTSRSAAPRTRSLRSWAGSVCYCLTAANPGNRPEHLSAEARVARLKVS